MEETLPLPPLSTPSAPPPPPSAAAATATATTPQPTDPPAGVAEMSPNKRYIRFDEVVSRTGDSIQDSYKAFDTKNGIEVAWHTINLNSLAESEQIGVTQCVNILKKIQDKHVIEYLACWFRAETRTLNVITTHLDTLKEFISKVFTLRWRIVKKWCRQILRGLDHLHSHEPQIIHRNLTCSHIYIDSGLSATNIGDLWLAAVIPDDQGAPVGLSDSMIKDLAKKTSPAFIAPELYDSGKVTSKVDIYSFGMCVISMITRDEPYQECKENVTKLRSKVMSGRAPRAVNSISSPLARQFIMECLKPVAERPTAAQLLQHPFLVTTSEDDEQVQLEQLETPEMPESTNPSQVDDIDLLTSQALELGFSKEQHSPPNGDDQSNAAAEAAQKSPQPQAVTGQWDKLLGKELADLDHGENVHVDRGLHDGRRAADDMPAENAALEGKKGAAGGSSGRAAEEKTAIAIQNVTELQLKIIIPASKTREREADKEVEFTFDVLKDNFWTVASEMIEELQLALSVEELAAQIATVVVKPHIDVRLAAAAPAKYVVPESLAEEKTASSNSVAQISATPPPSSVDTASAVASGIASGDVEAMSADPSPASDVTDATDIPHVVASADATLPTVPTEPEAAFTRQEAASISALDLAAPAVIELPTPDISQSPTDPQTAPIVPTANAPPEAAAPRREIEMDMCLTSMDDVERELEKLDKESRIARRAFEQRIQKHKSIQEQCQDDFLRVEEEYANKRSELERKEESAMRRRDDEVSKLQAELEAKLRAYRERKISESRAARLKAREGLRREAEGA